MLLSLNWLKQYIDLPKNLAPKQLADDLTMATVEVESVKNMAEDFEKIVVGKVVKLEKHPNADKLKLAYVDIGYENIKTLKHKDKLVKIVCGGTNLYEGMLAAVALPGAKVKWHGQGEPVVLEKAKIRGEESFGMICASNEIGLQDMFPCGKMEVTDLSKVEGIKIGQPLSQALGLDDVVVEIENKSLTNRPDLWNHYGMARELSVIYKTKLKNLDLYQEEEIEKLRNKEIKGLKIKIENKELCSRYIGCVVNNVKIKKSPEWLIKRLEAVGMRAINNIVDITNYVMLDVGEPMHAFDKSKIQNPKIIVRTAKKGEKIKTLDGELRQLDETMLVIADAEKPIAVAGIMGGANSEVDEKTQSIVLEAATFDPISVRKTAQKLGLRTEASIRFEKNLDPNLAELGMRRALKLIKEILPEAEIGPMVDVDYSSKKRIAIKVEHEFLEKRVGQKLDTRVVVDVLERLGFVVKTQNTIPSTRDKAQESVLYNILVPTWRATGDVSIPEDIVEEVARIYGYDNLKEKIEMVEMRKAVYQREFEIEKKVKDYLSLGCGMNEVFNYPWTEEGVLKNLGFLDPNFEKEMIELANPPSKENRYLATSLIPNLIRNIKDNLRYFDEFRIFELARVFKFGREEFDGQDRLPRQPKMLAGAVVLAKDKDAFLEVKGIIEQFPVFNFQFPNNFQLNNFQFLNKNKSLEIVMGKEKIGWLGEMKEKIKNKNIGLFEINFDHLVGTGLGLFVQKYQPLPQYPSIERDLAIEVEWGVKWADVKDVILKQVQVDIVSKVEFLSEYDLGNKKSLAFRVVYQTDRTLKDEEVEVVEKKIIRMLEEKFRARLRG